MISISQLVSGNGTLNGTVIDKETNGPVAGAVITLYSGYPDVLVLNTTTDADGSYSIVLPSRTYAMNINASGYVTYDAGVTVYVEQTVTRKIYLEKFGIEATKPAEFEIESLPLDTTFFLGERAIMKFRIRNIGDMIGKIQVNLTILGIYENVNYTWIKPGVEEDITFTFTVPDDLEEKEYKMYYVIDGTEYEKKMTVVGMNISVDAGLDKKMYLAGDTAVLSLNVTNLKDFNVSLFSRVKFNGYDNVTCFNLTGLGNETLTFYVPVEEFSGDKLFYSVYAESGRALYINALYIYQKLEGDVVLYTDKQVYEIGESVTITAEAMVGGTLNITAPGFSENITIGGVRSNTQAINFTLPELRSGSYQIDYTFGNYSGSYLFDVVGYSAKVIEADLDKTSYEIGENLSLKLNIEANRKVSGTLKLFVYDPQSNLVSENEENINLNSGENKIDLFVPFTTTYQTGIHSLFYSFYADIENTPFLVSGVKYFDALDTTPPEILNVTVSTVSKNYVTVMVITNERTNCYIEYGLATGYGNITSSFFAGRTHILTISDLTPSTTYHYRVTVVDLSGNNATSEDYTFTTTEGYTIKTIEDLVTCTKVKLKYYGSGNISINQTTSPGAVPSNLLGINIFIEITAPGTMEVEWAYIEISYDENSLPSGIYEEKLSMYYYDKGSWKKCDSTGVDTANNIVYANVTHFTVFAPMAEKTASAEPAPVSWLIYAGVIGAVIAIFAISLVMMKKRKKGESE